MQFFSRQQSGLVDVLTHIFYFLILYLTTSASAQQPTEPNNGLEVLSVSAIESIQFGSTNIRVIFYAEYQSKALNLDCGIEFPALVGPPDEYVSTIPFLLSSLFEP